MISLWYVRNEQAIRIGIFFSAATVAGAFGGLLAYGIAHLVGPDDSEKATGQRKHTILTNTSYDSTTGWGPWTRRMAMDLYSRGDSYACCVHHRFLHPSRLSFHIHFSYTQRKGAHSQAITDRRRPSSGDKVLLGPVLVCMERLEGACPHVHWVCSICALCSLGGVYPVDRSRIWL